MSQQHRTSRQLSFQQLESRHLLAADLIHFREGGGAGYDDATFVDTYLASYEDATTVHGHAERLSARTWDTGAHEIALIAVADLFARLPQVSTSDSLQIESAHLHLFSDNTTGDGSHIKVHRITSDWANDVSDENLTSRAFRDLTTSSRWVRGNFSRSDYAPDPMHAVWRGAEGVRNVIDVTSLVQSMYANGVNEGLAVVGDSQRVSIASSDNSNVGRRPSLEIRYSYPTESPSDTSRAIHFRQGGGTGFTDVVFDDAYVTSYSSSTTGTATALLARTWGSTAFETSLIGINKLFELLPKTDGTQAIQITSAKLHLTSHLDTGGAFELGVHLLKSDWLNGLPSRSESDVNGQYRNVGFGDSWLAGSFSPADYGSQVASAVWRGAAGAANVVDVTALVQTMYANGLNEGFAIVGSSDRAIISSSEHPIVANRPSLEIHYHYGEETPPVAEPPITDPSPTEDPSTPDEPSGIFQPLPAELAPLERIAELPHQSVDTTYSIPTGGKLYVVNGGNSAAFQAALDAAVPGDIIELEAGETFEGNFTIDNRHQQGDGWIHIRSSRHSELPAPGNRVSAAHRHLMPKIKSTGVSGNSRAIQLFAGSHHVRFVGIEVSSTLEHFTVQRATNLIVVGLERDESFADSVEETAHHIIFDRSYIHGTDEGNITNGIQAHARHFAIVDSEISNIHSTSESHALLAYNGPGPYKIHNSSLQAAGIPVLFGGADPGIQQLVQSDIEFTRNVVSKDIRWKERGPRSDPASKWLVKHLFELKNARRVLVDGNIFEYSWTYPTDGAAILIKSTNQDQYRTGVGCTWCVTEDVTIRNNIIRHAAAGIRISGRDSSLPHGGQTSRIVVANNLFYDINHLRWSTSQMQATGKPIIATEDYRDVHFIHNTFDATGSTAAFSTTATLQMPDTGRTASGLVIRDNILPYLGYGIKGPGLEGTTTLQTYAPGYEFRFNVLHGVFNRAFYPEGNFYDATSILDVGYLDSEQHNYRLATSSPYKNAASDGTDVGVHLDVVQAATACVVGGTCGVSPPTN